MGISIQVIFRAAVLIGSICILRCAVCCGIGTSWKFSSVYHHDLMLILKGMLGSGNRES